MADTCGFYFDQHLAGSRPVEIDRFDGERRTCFVRNSSFGFHLASEVKAEKSNAERTIAHAPASSSGAALSRFELTHTFSRLELSALPRTFRPLAERAAPLRIARGGAGELCRCTEPRRNMARAHRRSRPAPCGRGRGGRYSAHARDLRHGVGWARRLSKHAQGGLSPCAA